MEDDKLRKKLEHLETEIRISYLRDMDKTFEFQELKKILEEILTKESLDDYFNKNLGDTEYFCRKFTNEVMSNILKQSIILGQNGHNIALEILKLYLKIYLKFMSRSSEQPYYGYLMDNIKELFEYSKPFYRQKEIISNKEVQEMKSMTAEFYNVYF